MSDDAKVINRLEARVAELESALAQLVQAENRRRAALVPVGTHAAQTKPTKSLRRTRWTVP